MSTPRILEPRIARAGQSHDDSCPFCFNPIAAAIDIFADYNPLRHKKPPNTQHTMATRTLESCFDRLSVNDENDPGESGRLYVKPKVCINSLNVSEYLR